MEKKKKAVQRLKKKECDLTEEFSFCWLMPSAPMTRSIAMFQPCCRRRRAYGHRGVGIFTGQFLSLAQVSHRQLTREPLLSEGVALRQGAEELDHALLRVQRAVALEGLLDEAAQLLGLNQPHRPTLDRRVRRRRRRGGTGRDGSAYLHAADQLFGEKHVQSHVPPEIKKFQKNKQS